MSGYVWICLDMSGYIYKNSTNWMCVAYVAINGGLSVSNSGFKRLVI